MSVFIKGVGNISPQMTYDNEHFLDEIISTDKFYLKAKEPSYNDFINPREARRMSHIIKMGLVSSMICMKDSGVEKPDAIIIGTGMGCIEDTEKFLNSIIVQEEKLLSPTPFIMSTHNTVSSQIAMTMKCNGYNFTYAHRGFSFESALVDAMMTLIENAAKNILVGGVDEITTTALDLTIPLNIWKNEPVENTKLLDYKTQGTIAGEGSAFFLLSNEKSSDNYAEIAGMETFYKPDNIEEIKEKISAFLKKFNTAIDDIDLVLFGLNGDIAQDKIYYELMNDNFIDKNIAFYKHLCGEYQTSSAFSLWLAAKIIKHKIVPNIINLKKVNSNPPKRILIYNHYIGINHSLILLQR